ncbi:MAG: NADH-quinone oxidoreductase subunit NuoN [Hyphomicrobiaceae bacterium]|nr:NADH-quinone oxidoreductase subunit NuoN [Hyphomicrobiaceae bacterium]
MVLAAVQPGFDVNWLRPLIPELIVAVSAMVILMIGSFRTGPTPPEGRSDPRIAREGDIATWLAIFVMAVAMYFVATPPVQTITLFDGAFIGDAYARFFKILILAGGIGALLMSFDDLRRINIMQFEYPVLVLLAVVGMMMMVSANDLISLYLALELQSLALYVLAAMRRDDVRSSEAGLKYFVLGALSSGMLLYGASLIYGFTGSTNFAVIAKAAASPGAAANIGLIVGLVFLLVGLAFKVSAVPFHMWTPDVYEGAPTPVTAFFAAVPKLAAMALLVRVLSTAFPGDVVKWQQIIVFISIASMVLGSFAAIGQNNIKRLLAYSSIGHVGFALVGLAANTESGIQGVLIYLAIYLPMTLGAFACVLAMRRESGPVEDITELAGLSKTNPTMAFIMAALMFSLAGIPPLAGFLAKLFVFRAAVEANLWMLAVVGVIASVIGAYYYLRVVKIMFFDEAKAPFSPVDTRVFLVMALAGIAVTLFFPAGGPLIEAAGSAARSLKAL